MADQGTQSIRVCSLRYADRLLATGEYSALVSIGRTDGTRHCERRAKKSLLLGFDDCTPWNVGRRKRLMTGEQMVELIHFAESLAESERCLIHCRAGRSRSVSAAIVVQYVRNGCIYASCKAIAEMVPKGTPNGWMLGLADIVLGHYGTSETLRHYADWLFPNSVKEAQRIEEVKKHV